jgi:hypothetical protein
MSSQQQAVNRGRLPPGLGASRQFLKVEFSNEGAPLIVLAGMVYDAKPGPLAQIAHVRYWAEERHGPKNEHLDRKWSHLPQHARWDDTARTYALDNGHLVFEHIEFTLLIEGREGCIGYRGGGLRDAREVCNQLARIFQRDDAGKVVRDAEGKLVIAPYYASRWRVTMRSDVSGNGATYHNLVPDLVAKPGQDGAPDEEECAVAEALDEMLTAEDRVNFADPDSRPSETSPNVTPLRRGSTGKPIDIGTSSYSERNPPPHDDDSIPF